MRRLPILRDNSKPSVCGPCAGACCKDSPGIAHPADFGAPDRDKMRAVLYERLSSGLWAIDWWEGDPRPHKKILSSAEFIRPATKGYEGRLLHGSWGGECALLTPTGCSLTFADRPLQCRALRPHESQDCRVPAHAEKRALAITWLEFTDVIAEVGERIERERKGKEAC